MDIDSITFGITYLKRPAQLARLISSISKFHRCPKIIVLDTGGNLSAARNKLVDLCDTPYYMLLEEDMILLPQTNLPLMWEAMQRFPNLAGVSGGLMERGKTRYCAGVFRHLKSSDSRRRCRTLVMEDSHRLYFKQQLISCQCTYNWGLFRTSVLREVRWNERLELSEHYEFFYRLSRRYRVACSRGVIGHTRSRPSSEYNLQRTRIMKFRKRERDECHLEFSVDYDRKIWETIDALRRKVRRRAALG